MQRAVQQAGITRTPNFVASRCPGAPTPAGSCSCVRARSANIWATPHGYKSRHYRSTIEGAQVHLAAQHKTHTSMAVCGRRSGGRRHLVGAGLTLLLQIGLLVFFFFFQESASDGMCTEQHCDAPRQARRRWCVRSTSTRATVPVLERTQRHCDPYNTPRSPLSLSVMTAHTPLPSCLCDPDTGVPVLRDSKD